MNEINGEGRGVPDGRDCVCKGPAAAEGVRAGRDCGLDSWTDVTDMSGRGTGGRGRSEHAQQPPVRALLRGQEREGKASSARGDWLREGEAVCFLPAPEVAIHFGLWAMGIAAR